VSNPAWLHTLRQLCNEVDQLAHIMEQGPGIIPKLSQTEQGWELTLAEVWDDNIFEVRWLQSGSEMLDEKIEWVDQKLQSQQNCAKIDFDRWVFQDKIDAEKFITLYHLTWAK
jgi:hypothetical protein